MIVADVNLVACLVLGGPEQAVAERVLHLVASSACSAYNCEYVALAEELGVSLVTADRQLSHAFPGRAISPKDFVTGAA